MLKSFVLGSFAAALLGAGAASAALVPVTVSATGTYNGNLAVLKDGVVPANGSQFNTPDKVSFTNAGQVVFRFDFGADAMIESLLATVDNNDNYLFRLFDGDDALVRSVSILGNEGTVGFGVETFTRAFAPTTARYALVTASNGDNQYSVGEVQFTGTVQNAVPEPASWALMIAGFGLAGTAMRRRDTRRIVTA